MSFHRNAKLGLAGRYALVCAVEGGMTLKAAAAAFSVSPATAHRWWHRWLEAGEEARATLACLFDRSSRPHRSPRRLAPELAERICACRRQTGWGPRLVAGATGFCHSTVWKVLKRAGISRPPKPAREPANSYEWPCPGDLLHMDTSEYVRFQRSLRVFLCIGWVVRCCRGCGLRSGCVGLPSLASSCNRFAMSSWRA